MAKNIQAIRGMNDYLPGETALWQRIEGSLKQVLGSYGYSEIRLPIVEQTPLFKRAIGEVTYLAMGMADLSVYFPVYSGVSAYPEHFGMGTDKADDKSLYWKFRKLQTLVIDGLSDARPRL